MYQKRNDSNLSSAETATEFLTNNSGMISGTVNKLSLLSDAPFTHAIENMLLSLNDLDLFGWASSIFVAALIFRMLVSCPIKVYQEHIVSRLVEVQPKIMARFEEKTKSINKNSIFMTPELKKILKKQVFKITL